MIVAPDHCAYPTLALIEGVDPPVRYRVDAGTRLTLLATYDPDEDERVRDLDMVSYYQWAEGWATRTFRIDDGPSAGPGRRSRLTERFSLSLLIARRTRVDRSGWTPGLARSADRIDAGTVAPQPHDREPCVPCGGRRVRT